MRQVSCGDENTARLRPPADPWAAQDGRTQEFPSALVGTRRRRVFGYVYELFTGDPQDGPHPYVGKTTQTIHQRVHGPGGHTSPGEVAQSPWKARILPGRAGYRCLKTIYATGNEVEDQMRLDLAEAILIDELRTTYNDQRPIRSPGAPRPASSGIVRDRPARRREARRPVPVRAIGFLLLAASITYLVARVVVSMALPWPAAPWVVAPVIGVGLGWRVFWAAHRRAKRLMPGRRRRR